MIEGLASALLVALLVVVYLGLGIWIFAGLMLVAFTGLALILGMEIERIGAILKGIMWRSATNWELSAIPIFLLMGEIMIRTDISERLFRGLSPWVNAVPGRLLHVNVLGSALFGAVCGSSTATTATIGKMSISALGERDYDAKLTVGSIAGAGSLGIMIPPSISLIVYGFLAETSVSRLFAAGIFPGLLIAGLFSLYIIARSLISPSLAPSSGEIVTVADRLRSIITLLPVVLLMTAVLGSIYLGIATPSEAAAVGLVGSLLLALGLRQLSWAAFRDALKGTVATTAMLLSIVVAAGFLSSALGYLHVPQEIGRAIARLELSPYELMLIITLFYLLLGMFLDGVSILVMSLPITLPLVVAQGFDPVWFGIYLVVLIEISLLTPPVGFNLFVMQALTGRPLSWVARASFPFFLLLLLAAMILTTVPEIALWLPDLLFGVSPQR